MTETPNFARPQLLHGGRADEEADPRVATQSAVDLRVSMVLEVLGGRTVEVVAQEWDIESSTLHRWVRDFLVAGTAVITNRPDPDEARQRDRFMAAFAHELRTPVTVAQGWAMVLAEGDVPADQVTGSLERLADALGRLSEHIADVELTASVSLGRIRVGIEPVGAAGLGEGLARCSGVRRGADLTVHADPRLLHRIVADLWNTALREPDPEEAWLEVVEVGTWSEVRVVRQGAPISPMVLKALFDPFGSNDDATGVTTGLYMARALTVAHGGILGAEGDDQRTVLYARLPREPASGSGAAGPGAGGDKEESP